MSKLEMIVGSMFSGKTEELIRRIKRAVIAGQGVQVFKPMIDTRYGQTRIVSHAKTDLETHTGIVPEAIEEHSRVIIKDNTVLVAIDECQFFSEAWIREFVLGLISDNIRVICAGLDMDAMGNPFGGTPTLLAMADSVTKLKAICSICKADAGMTYRQSSFNSDSTIEIGGFGLYEPRCRICWKPPAPNK